MTTIHDFYVDSFQKQINENDPFAKRREVALAYYQKGISGDRWLDFKTELLQLSFPINVEITDKEQVLKQLKKESFDVSKASLIVFLNGRFSKELSVIKPLPEGSLVGNLKSFSNNATVKQLLGEISSYERNEEAFTALNEALFDDGLFLHVAKGQVISDPIHVVYWSGEGDQKNQSFIRNLIILEPQSGAKVIEHYLGKLESVNLTNVVTEVELKKDSHLRHVKILEGSTKANHVGNFAVQQEEGSHLRSRLFSLFGKDSSSSINIEFNGGNAEALMDGLFLASDKQKVDVRTFVNHKVPSCASNQIFKGIVDKEAVGLFEGGVLVAENAQKTDARQSNKNLLLTREAKIYSKPQLQIYADDVKCSHGSATGQLDEEALFYMQSRGIGRQEARNELIYAFAAEMVERVEDSYLRPALERIISDSWGHSS